jgi:hypothetical protein
MVGLEDSTPPYFRGDAHQFTVLDSCVGSFLDVCLVRKLLFHDYEYICR